ncbi:hypothetical protein E2I00_015160 [Balaenoptera physalus]|uniref:Uncharacterized protein n=1 Tax=Balaenoptera physalus TaxID=9770 RepID=A0A643BUV7_BALPH|nr:hypothetical protein E2I00_015160 [Balaenoptera physalus]
MKLMTLCTIETLRIKGLATLQLYINKLDSQGKYTLCRCLLNTSNDSGYGNRSAAKLREDYGLIKFIEHIMKQKLKTAKKIVKKSRSGEKIPAMTPEIQFKVLYSTLSHLIELKVFWLEQKTRLI